MSVLQRALCSLLFLAGCVESHPAEDAATTPDAIADSPADAAHEDTPPLLGEGGMADATIDAAPPYEGLVCTGHPIPEGLSCVVQDAATVGPCDGHGGIAFDGVRCRLARGGSCPAAGVGAFDSLEECGVTCAAAGFCDFSAMDFIPPDGARVPFRCGEAPTECVLMYSRLAYLIPDDCVVWGPFSVSSPQVRSSEIPFPDHWPLLYSLSLAGDVLGYVTCDQNGS